MLRRSNVTALAVTAVLALGVGNAPEDLLPEEARARAGRLVDGIADYSLEHPAAPSAMPEWAGAVAARPVLVHGYVNEAGSYYLAPVRDPDGQVIATIGIDAKDGKWLWYAATKPRDALFPVETADVPGIVFARFGAYLPLESIRLVVMPNKELYWHASLASAGGVREFFVSVADPAIVHTERTREAAGLTRSLGPRWDPARFEDPVPDPGTADSAGESFYPSSYDITTLPHYYQDTTYHCGPAALEMVFDYRGPHVNQTDIGYVANTDPYVGGTYEDDLRRASHFSYISTAIQDPSLHGYDERDLGYGSPTVWWTDPTHYPDRYDDLKELISNDDPVLLLTWFDGTHQSGHFRVVKGYNDATDVFIVHDPWFTFGPDLNLNQAFLVDDLWPYSGRWGLHSSPWNAQVTAPAAVDCCAQFTVTADVAYQGPHPFEGQDPASDPQATITLPPGFSLADGENATKALTGLDRTGSAGSASWQVVAPGYVTSDTVQIEARGEIQDYAGSDGNYTDHIGGLAGAMVASINSDLDCDGHDDVVDCDDADDRTYPGAPEVNDGRDNQCPGDPGHGVADETTGDSGFHDPSDKTAYCWPPQEGATEYEARRSSSPAMSSPCAGTTTTDTCWYDTAAPSPGGGFFYLNRPTAPHAGSWGQDSGRVERTGVCP